MRIHLPIIKSLVLAQPDLYIFSRPWFSPFLNRGLVHYRKFEMNRHPCCCLNGLLKFILKSWPSYCNSYSASKRHLCLLWSPSHWVLPSQNKFWKSNLHFGVCLNVFGSPQHMVHCVIIIGHICVIPFLHLAIIIKLDLLRYNGSLRRNPVMHTYMV